MVDNANGNVVATTSLQRFMQEHIMSRVSFNTDTENGNDTVGKVACSNTYFDTVLHGVDESMNIQFQIISDNARSPISTWNSSSKIASSSDTDSSNNLPVTIPNLCRHERLCKRRKSNTHNSRNSRLRKRRSVAGSVSAVTVSKSIERNCNVENSPRSVDSLNNSIKQHAEHCNHHHQMMIRHAKKMMITNNRCDENDVSPLRNRFDFDVTSIRDSTHSGSRNDVSVYSGDSLSICRLETLSPPSRRLLVQQRNTIAHRNAVQMPQCKDINDTSEQLMDEGDKNLSPVSKSSTSTRVLKSQSHFYDSSSPLALRKPIRQKSFDDDLNMSRSGFNSDSKDVDALDFSSWINEDFKFVCG